MKSRSDNRSVALTLVVAVTAGAIGFWSLTAEGQSSRRDRYYRRDGGQDSGRYGSSRYDGSDRTSSGRSDSSRRESPAPGTSAKPEATKTTVAPQEGRITKPAEPNKPPQQVEYRPPRPRQGQDQQWAPFEIIAQRNMFSRYRRAPLPVGFRREEPRPPMANPESYFLLRGIVQDNGQFIAFLEDKQSGNVLQLRVGDHVARGTIKSMTLDVLEYQLGDRTTSVPMGYDLEGGRGAILASDLANFTPPPAPAGGSAAPAGTAPALPANAAEILKRLMEQRRQQTGQ